MIRFARSTTPFGLAISACLMLLGATLSGCGSDGSSGSSHGGSAGAGGSSSAGASSGGSSSGGVGTTVCGGTNCGPGQYCLGNASCTPGCTSDQNCASNQTCGNVDSVTHVGTCIDGTTKNCTGFLTKCSACGGGASMCTQQVCDALSTACVNCLADANCSDANACPMCN